MEDNPLLTGTPGLCGCETCHAARVDGMGAMFSAMVTGFRYACEICGNKRCPHRTDHRLACTSSNEPGQKGSSWEYYKVRNPLAAVSTDALIDELWGRLCPDMGPDEWRAWVKEKGTVKDG